MPSRRHIAAADLWSGIVAGTAPAVLDVRSAREYEQGHVPGALHAPFWRLRRALGSLPLRPGTPVVVYCGHGPRAWIAAVELGRLGFADVTLLRGHMAGWQRAALPLATGRKP